MTQSSSNRRQFIAQSLAAGAALGALSALRPSRILGANDRVQIGIIGTGGRGRYHIGWLERTSKVEPLTVIAACDIWNVQREKAKEEIEKRFQVTPALYKDYREMLDNKDIDAVLIATPDHQHCPMAADAVKAGKDVYVEKPIAITLEELNELYDVVKASDRVVQHGTQGRSSAGAKPAREFVQSGQLGKILRIEECRSHYIPYWNHYPKPEREEDTDWKAFLFNRPYRPFDADQHACWMGYRDFSSGTVGGWMSHFSDFLHFITGAGFPITATAQGGIYSPTSDPRRTCPDTVTAILDYPEGFTTLYTTHFGNAANDYTIFFGTKGTMVVNDPDGNRDGIRARISGDGSEHPDKVKEPIELPNTTDEDHMANWVRCIRTSEQPNADMDAGYKHGVACILADRAYEEGRKMKFDPEKREIVPA